MSKNIVISAVMILNERLYHAYTIEFSASFGIAGGLPLIKAPIVIDRTPPLIKNSDLIRVSILALNSIP